MRGGGERLAVADVVVARADQHHRVGRQQPRRQRDRGGGVPGGGLDHDPRVGIVADLRLDMLEVGLPGHDDRRPEPGVGRAAIERGAEQRVVADQRQEWLGLGRPAAWPQPRPAAAAQDNRYDLCHCPSVNAHPPPGSAARGAGSGSVVAGAEPRSLRPPPDFDRRFDPIASAREAKALVAGSAVNLRGCKLEWHLGQAGPSAVGAKDEVRALLARPELPSGSGASGRVRR